MNKLLIVIVIYKKSIHDLTLIKDITKNSDTNIDIFIYDNSPIPQEVPLIDNVNIYYEHNVNNPGVSQAYNKGASKAKSLKKDLILVLDQDTNFIFEYIEKYIIAFNKYQNNYLYAPIVCDGAMTKVYSPAFLNSFIGKVQLFDNFTFNEKYNLNNKSVINSGLMIPLSLFEKISGFNDKIKLDFSDVYFIEKYKELNAEIILIDIYLKHSISGDEGKNYEAEMHRFKYYCNGAKELSKSLSQSTTWSVFRRMLRLIQKHYSLKPISVYLGYYLGERKL